MRDDVQLMGDTVWLMQEQMAALFGKAKSTINEHIRRLFAEGELDEQVVVRDFRTTTAHGVIGDKTQQSPTKAYNIDVVISVDYRVKSPQGTQFRVWAIKPVHQFNQCEFFNIHPCKSAVSFHELQG